MKYSQEDFFIAIDLIQQLDLVLGIAVSLLTFILGFILGKNRGSHA